ncbi:MAG: phosphodiester glycosidase family protein [Paludibacteraceae bacterium]|nr:phosphodiester glycosidase family protein [Paludibacteraceae bacterium]
MKRISQFILAFVLACPLWVTTARAIVLDGVDYRIDTLQAFPAGPGTDYLQLRMFRTSDGYGRLDAYILKVATQNPYIHFSHELGAGKVIGTERPTAIAERKTTPTSVYFAGTNGSFFATTGDVGTPSGLTVSEGQICTNRSSMHNYPVAGFDANKFAHFGNAWSFAGRVFHGIDTLTIAHMNYKRETNELVLYNQYNAAGTLTNEYGTELLLSLLPDEHWTTNGCVRATVSRKEINIGNMTIPAGQAVLSGHGTAAQQLNTFVEGDTVTLGISLELDGAKYALQEAASGSGSGHYMIIRDGVIRDPDMWAELHPRTAIGATQNGDTAIFCVIDGRGVSMGAKCKTVATIMQHYGAYNAVNWDGGGSSCMYVRQFGQVNKGSDGSERACGNSMFVVAELPTDDRNIASIVPYWPTYKLPRYGTYTPHFLGYNQYGLLLDTDVQGVTLSCDPTVGYIIADTTFVASGDQGGVLNASLGNIQTSIQVKLLQSAAVTFRLDSVLVNAYKPYKVEVQCQNGNANLSLLPDALIWQSLDPTIAEVSEAGVITGVANGSTQVIGILGDYADTLKVNVQLPDCRDWVFDAMDTTLWTVTSTAGFEPAWRVENEAYLDFTYKTGRGPYVTITYTGGPLYSLPDSIRIPFMTDALVSRVTFVMQANNDKATTSTQLFSNGVPQNTPVALTIPVDSIFPDDHAIYPLRLAFIKFWLDTKTTLGARYMQFGGVHLIYDDFMEETAVNYVESFSIQKILENGQVIILRNGARYNTLGQRVE